MIEQNTKILRQILTKTRSLEHKGMVVMPDGKEESRVVEFLYE